MNKFLFKSTEADFQKLYSILDTIQKNVLYSTHQVDFIRRTVKELLDNKHLQSQVDDFFGQDDETSPQTELEDK